MSPTCTLALCLGPRGAAQTAAPGAGAQTEETRAGGRDQTPGLLGPPDSAGCETSEEVPGQRRADPAGWQEAGDRGAGGPVLAQEGQGALAEPPGRSGRPCPRG